MKLLWTITYTKILIFLRTQLYRHIKDYRILVKHNFPKDTWFRGVSSAAVACNYKGSMTVEAAIAVPLFIFCVVNLLFGIQIVETSSRITAALHETGNEICSYGYAYEKGIGEGCPASVGTTLFAAGSIAGHLGKVTENRGGIRGGRVGINYLGSSVMDGNGIVKLVATYNIKYPVNMHIPSLRLGTSLYAHAWVGYDVTNGFSDMTDEDPIVYITPSGTVYHTSLDCPHLNPSVSTMDKSVVESMRNKDGSKYYPCEMCGDNDAIGVVFITDYGSRYHSDCNCPGIKRNIKAVHLSEVGGRRMCMTCGG